MDTAKIYYNADGQERTIWQLVREDPGWAANRVQEGEKAIDCVKELEQENERLKQRERECPTKKAADVVALVRCFQECLDALGMDREESSPRELVHAVKKVANNAK